MTERQEYILNKFIEWLSDCSQREYEDIHNIQFTTEECVNLKTAIMEHKS